MRKGCKSRASQTLISVQHTCPLSCCSSSFTRFGDYRHSFFLQYATGYICLSCNPGHVPETAHSLLSVIHRTINPFRRISSDAGCIVCDENPGLSELQTLPCVHMDIAAISAGRFHTIVIHTDNTVCSHRGHNSLAYPVSSHMNTDTSSSQFFIA